MRRIVCPTVIQGEVALQWKLEWSFHFALQSKFCTIRTFRVTPIRPWHGLRCYCGLRRADPRNCRLVYDGHSGSIDARGLWQGAAPRTLGHVE